jgi:hypothetical protein
MLMLAVSLIIFVAKCSGDLLQMIPKCEVSDNECLIRHTEFLFRVHDPMFVEKVSSSLEYTNVTIYGLKNTRVLSIKVVRADSDIFKVEIRFKIPTVTTLATYAANGKISFFNIHTKGNVNLTFGNYLPFYLKLHVSIFLNCFFLHPLKYLRSWRNQCKIFEVPVNLLCHNL